MKYVIVAFAALFVALPAKAGTKTLSVKYMSFGQCIHSIQSVAGKLGVAPVNIVETNALRMVRFPTNDGSGQSILVTCSRPDRKQVINLSW